MKHKIKKVLKYILLAYIVFYSFIWLTSPLLIRYFLTDVIAEQSLVLSDDSSIRYNPFTSHLAISDLSLTTVNESSQVVFSVKELELEIRFYQLLSDNVFVSEFIINGLYVNVETIENTIIVAGINLANTSQGNEPNSEVQATVQINEEDSEEEIEDAIFPYKLDIPVLTLKNSTIEVSVDESPHKIKLNSFIITDLGATLASQNLLLAIESEVNQSSLSLTIKADLNEQLGQVVIDLTLEKIELERFKHFLPDEFTTFEGQVSYHAKHIIDVDLLGENISIELKDLSLQGENIHIAQDNLNVALASYQLVSESLSVSLTKEEKPHVNGTAQWQLNDFRAFNHSDAQIIAAFEQLTLKDIVLSSEDDLQQVNINQITLANILFSDDSQNDIPALAQFSKLNINNTQLSEQGLIIESVDLAGVAIDAQLDENKILVNLIDLGFASETPNEQLSIDAEQESINDDVKAVVELESTDNKPPTFQIALSEFKLSDDAHIHLTDQSVAPIYQRHITLSTLNAGPIDNNKPEQESHFSLIGKSDKYANLNLSGMMKPFAKTPSYHLTGFIKEVSLPGISSYIKDALQYEIKSGQLDLEVDASLTGNIIDGEMMVMLRGIDLTAADDHEADSVKDKATVPFNMALGMLKDGNGNVELDVPLSGDTSSPSFGLSGFITLLVKEATMSAAKEYLLVTFVPYANVVSIAIAAGEYVLKLRINDLLYKTGITELQPEQQEFISQFSALLKDKKDAQIKLCAVATPQDIGKTNGTAITEKSDIERLKAISNQRIHTFKDHMVSIEKIKSSRLLLCTPQIDSTKEAKSRITFVI